MKRILIVEDEIKIREVFKHALIDEQYAVAEAGDTEELTHRLLHSRFDLILLDMRLPDVQGSELFDVIQEYNPAAKVIITSIFPVEEQRRMFPVANDYYDKAQGSMDLIIKINKALY